MSGFPLPGIEPFSDAKQLRILYINKYSLASVEDGSSAYPYKTFQAAATAIGEPTNQAEFETQYVFAGTPGFYDEDVLFPVNRQVQILSMNPNEEMQVAQTIYFGTTASDITSTRRNLTMQLDSSKRFGSSRAPYMGLRNVQIMGALIVKGLDGIGTISDLYMENSTIAQGLQGDPLLKCAQTFAISMRNSGIYSLDPLVVNAIDFVNIAGIRLDQAIDSDFYAESFNPVKFDQTSICWRAQFWTGLHVVTPQTDSYQYGFFNCDIQVSLETAGVASFDSATLAQFIANGSTLLGGGSMVMMDGGFVPAVSGNWTVAPTNYYDALDELASRVKALEPP